MLVLLFKEFYLELSDIKPFCFFQSCLLSFKIVTFAYYQS